MNVERINLLDLQKEELTPQEKEEIYGKKIEKQNIGPDEADKIEEGFLAKNEVENNKKSKEIKMTQKKNEERGIEFFKKEIARLKKEIEKINNKKEKDPGNENLESRSTELEEILKKAEEELTEIRYGDSEIEKIANKEAEEVTSITIPDDKERRRRLELKLESYKEGGDDSRAIILGLVLEEGRIDIETIMGKVKEAVGDKFNHFEFVSDYRIIKDYCETGGENVSGGGLPEVPVEEDIESKIAEAQRGAEALKEVTDEKIGKTVSEVEKEPSVIEAEEGKKIEEKPVVSEEGETLVEEEPVIKSAEPTETEAGRSWDEIRERAGGAEEVIKGMEAKVFEKIEGVEENPDIPKHEKEKAVFSLGIKEGKLDTVRITTEMAQLKAEEFKLKEGIKGVRLKLEEEGLDETKEGELQEELKGLEIERHRIIRETTRLAIEKRNGLESLKLSIEAAAADQNLKISKWEKGAGEKKEGFISGLAGAIKHKTEEARAALAESYKRINKESENDMINDVKGASSFNELKSVIDNLKTADTKEEAQNFLSELYNRLDSLENSVDLDKELDEMRKDLNSRKGILKLKLKKLTTSERKVFESLLDHIKVLAEGGEEESGETPGEIPLPPPPVSEVPGGGTGEGSEEGAGEREQLGNEKKEEIKRILNGLESEEVEILKQAFGNAMDSGYADWKVAALFRSGSDINDIIIKDNSEVLEEVAVEQLMEVIEEYSEEEFGGGEVLEEGEINEKENIKKQTAKDIDHDTEIINQTSIVGFIDKIGEYDERIRAAIEDNTLKEEDTAEQLKKDFKNFAKQDWSKDFNFDDFRKKHEIAKLLKKELSDKEIKMLKKTIFALRDHDCKIVNLYENIKDNKNINQKIKNFFKNVQNTQNIKDFTIKDLGNVLGVERKSVF